MSRLRSVIYLLPQIWRTLRTLPITVCYPFAPLDLPSSFRGRVVIDVGLCRGCGICVRDCPAFGLELYGEGSQVSGLVHYPDRCAYCGQCEASCPMGAVRLIGEYIPAASAREQLTEVFVIQGDDRPER